MAVTPQFAATAKASRGVLSTGNTNRDGSGSNQVTIAAAGANGSRIDRLVIVATGTTTDGMVRLFTHDGTNYTALKEVVVYAQTPSATIEAYSAEIVFDAGLPLPNGWSLRATTHNSESFHVTAFGGDF